MQSGWGILGLLTALSVGTVPVAGCTINACPAIGYISSVTVNLEGNTAAVNDVTLCDATGCSQPAPTPGTPGPSKSVVPWNSPEAPAPAISPSPAPSPSVSFAPSPAVTFAPFYGTREDGDTWVFTMSSGSPDHVSIKAIARDGTVLAEKEQDLVWTRVGGSAQCGGPVTTPPIQLRVP